MFCLRTEIVLRSCGVRIQNCFTRISNLIGSTIICVVQNDKNDFVCRIVNMRIALILKERGPDGTRNERIQMSYSNTTSSV